MTLDTTFGNWSTAEDMRSLSFKSFNETLTNSTINSALLYYENPTGNVSALLQRTNAQGQITWVDITSQESKSLPDNFRNAPEPYDSYNDYNISFTLYELDNNATFSIPFTSAPNFAGNTMTALFYSPKVSTENSGPLLLGSGYDGISGSVVPGSPGYVLKGMHFAFAYSE